MKTAARFLVLFLLLAGCQATDNYVAPAVPGTANTPFVTVRPDTMTFSAEARNWSHGESHLLDFSQELYFLNINVTNYRGGLLVTEIRDVQGSVVRLDSVTSDTSYVASRAVRYIPRYFSIWMDNFSGSISISFLKRGNTNDFAFSRYPLDPGWRWVYTLTTGQLPDVDTVILTSLARIVTPSRRDSTIIRLERYVGRYLVERDTLAATAGIDTIDIQLLGPPSSLWYPLRLVFPMVFGSQWKGLIPAGRGDYKNVSVVGVEPVIVPAGTFNQCYILVEQMFSTRWLVPGVGIVRQEYRDPWYMPQTWNLVRYRGPSDK